MFEYHTIILPIVEIGSLLVESSILRHVE